MNSLACAVCDANDWMPLPDPAEGSVTTGGLIFPQPLGKAQCRQCALVQRTAQGYLARTDFYEKSYSFYERPGAEHFDRHRYRAMADWIRTALPTEPRRVLDAGCGRGWMMEAMREVLPEARFSGIEPSEQESENARRRGLDVTTGRIAIGTPSAPLYDVVYSTNVLEHTESPVSFLQGLATMIDGGGCVVITCPDSSHPGAELMFADQSFSFLPLHLTAMATRAGLHVERWQGAPRDVSLRDKQLVVLMKAKAPTSSPPTLPERESIEGLYRRRCEYFQSWNVLNETLRHDVRGAARVYNFGTSTWSFLLAAYCPDYWSLVSACTIHGGTGQFFGKPVYDADQICLTAEDVVVLGVDPDRQSQFSQCFARTGARIVTWNRIITR